MFINDSEENIKVSEVLIASTTAAILMILIFLSWPFITDDAYITFRYGYNLALGHGLTFNPEFRPVEGYSNFSFVILSAFFIKMGFGPVLIIRLICVVSGILCIPVLYLFCRYAGVPHILSIFFCLLFSLSSGFAYWTVSGIETTFYTLVLTLGILFFIQNKQKTDIIGALLFVLASITRPETPVFFIVLGLLRIFMRLRKGQSPKEIFRRDYPWVILFLALYGGYFLFRFLYFRTLLPNPVYFKSSFPLDDSWGKYGEFGMLSMDFIKAWWPFHCLAAFSLLSIKRKNIASILLVFVSIILYTNTKPIISHFDRFFLPIIPCLMVASARGLTYFWKKGVFTGRIAVFAILGLLLAWQFMNPYVNPFKINKRATNYKLGKSAIREKIGIYLSKKYGDEGSIAIGDIGLVGYIFKNTVYDIFGLTSYKFTLVYKRNVSKYVNYILSKRPDTIVICVIRKEGVLFPRYEAGRIVISNPSFRNEYKKTIMFVNPIYNYHYIIYERIRR